MAKLGYQAKLVLRCNNYFKIRISWCLAT